MDVHTVLWFGDSYEINTKQGRCEVLHCAGAMHKGTAVSQPGQRRGSGGTALTLLEVEVVWSLGRPESHGVHSVVLVSRHWGVVRHGKDNLKRTVSPLVTAH